MQVKVDQDGYITDYCIGGSIADSVDVAQPEGFVQQQYRAYRLIDGALTLDTDRLAALQLAGRQDAIRARRERECYSVINRGQLWYEGVSISHLVELRKWYKAWLDAPATLVIPDKPDWLD